MSDPNHLDQIANLGCPRETFSTRSFSLGSFFGERLPLKDFHSKYPIVALEEDPHRIKASSGLEKDVKIINTISLPSALRPVVRCSAGVRQDRVDLPLFLINFEGLGPEMTALMKLLRESYWKSSKLTQTCFFSRKKLKDIESFRR